MASSAFDDVPFAVEPGAAGELHVVLLARHAGGLGGDVHPSLTFVGGGVDLGLIEDPQDVAGMVVGAADAGAVMRPRVNWIGPGIRVIAVASS